MQVSYFFYKQTKKLAIIWFQNDYRSFDNNLQSIAESLSFDPEETMVLDL